MRLPRKLRVPTRTIRRIGRWQGSPNTDCMRHISELMTHNPQTIGCDQRLDVALAMMRALEIRHLPVLEDGKLVGLLTDGDVPAGPDASLTARVSERMRPGPYTVAPDTSLDEVAEMFATCKFEVAFVVAPGDHVLGVFTTVDLARVLVNTLKAKLPSNDGHFNRWGHPVD